MIKPELNDKALKEKQSRKGRTSRQKGSNFERSVAKIYSDTFNLEFARTPQSGGFQKKVEVAPEFRGDIVSLDKELEVILHTECKNQKTWALKKWLEQAKEDCPKGRIPVVVFHEHGTSNNYVSLSLNDFLSIIDMDTVIKEK